MNIMKPSRGAKVELIIACTDYDIIAFAGGGSCDSSQPLAHG
jgi:hypothetical protein